MPLPDCTFFGYKPLLIFAKALFNAAQLPNKEPTVLSFRHVLCVTLGLACASIAAGAEPSDSQPARSRDPAARPSKPPPTFANQQLGRRVASKQPSAETPRAEELPPPRRSRVDLPVAETSDEPADDYAGELFAGEGGGEFDELHEFGHDCGQPGCRICGGSGFGLFSGFYVRGEYLGWATSGMNLPPLVTTATAGTARAGAGALGRAPTSILFGGNDVNEEMRSGGRITLGLWFDSCRKFGLEGDYFALDDARTSFLRSSTGNPILARPFFNMLTGQESAELVAFPNVVSGTVDANALTRFQGAGIRMRHVLCCGSGCGPSWCDPCGGGVLRGYRLNLLGGYRFLRLDDSVNVSEDLVSTDTANPGSFRINDSFYTQNQFHGVDFGTLIELRRGCWTLDLLSKIALGNNHSIVRINGNTDITENNVTTANTGGLLAQRTNIGTYTNDRFAVVPELGITLGYNVTPCLRAVVGYTFIYWSQVARAGDQISRDLNPNLLPPENVPFTGALRPQFAYHFTDFWAQGVNVGLEGRF